MRSSVIGHPSSCHPLTTPIDRNTRYTPRTRNISMGLGADFWGNFGFKGDKAATKAELEKALSLDLDATGLQVKLIATKDGEEQVIPIDKAQENCATVRTQLRSKGWQVPSNKNTRCACMWCFTVKSCSSTQLQQHLVTCTYCPESVKNKFRTSVLANEKSMFLGTKAKAAVEEAAAEAAAAAKAGNGGGGTAVSRKRSLDSFLDRELSADEIADIDQGLARFCYTEGLAFRALANSELRSALGKLNSSWERGTRLSDWTLRHEFLDKEYARVTTEVANKISKAMVCCLISDGWSGVQKKHVLNVLLTAPEPLFIENIYTKEAEVTGTYQFDAFCRIFDEYQDKIGAICTDNASTMRKTWRLLRAKFHGLYTYGCSPHAFQLHAKDLCKLDHMEPLLAGVSTIVTWFSRHLQKGGRASLDVVQQQCYSKTMALVTPVKTRWNSQVMAARSLLESQTALRMLVVDPQRFDTGKTGATELQKLILDQANTFWTPLQQFVDFMDPLRYAIHTLQADRARLSDVYACFVRVHKRQTMFMAGNGCTFSEETKGEVERIFKKRFEFLYHPAHLVAFALDPRYAKDGGAPLSVVRHWVKTLHNNPDESAALTADYAKFIGSQDESSEMADVWTAEQVGPDCDVMAWWRSWGREFPTLRKLALKLFSLPPSAAAAERNWSTQDFLISKRRNRLAADRANKLISIYFNHRSLGSHPERPMGLSEEKLAAWLAEITPLASFEHATTAMGKGSWEWTGEAGESFDGMHGDELEEEQDDNENEDDEEEDEFKPFDDDEYEVLPCPARVPHDMKPGDQIAMWFGAPYNEWFIGPITEVHPKRKKTDNIHAEFEGGLGQMSARSEQYGVDKAWVLVKKAIPMEMVDEDED